MGGSRLAGERSECAEISQADFFQESVSFLSGRHSKRYFPSALSFIREVLAKKDFATPIAFHAPVSLAISLFACDHVALVRLAFKHCFKDYDR